MIVFSIFRPPGENEELSACKLGDVCDATEFSYEQYFCGVGTFEIKMPITTSFGNVLQPNCILYTPKYGGFIIKNILRTEAEIKVTGYDLNGILRDRLTLTADESDDGKDEVAGSTEYCVKYYVDRNLINAADENRNIPRLAVATAQSRGIQNDHYLASPENLDDVVRTMCENAKLGYRVNMIIANSNTNPVFVFDVAERFDAHSAGGNRPAFSVALANIESLNRENGITAERNALWCDTGAANQFVYKDDAVIPASWNRREEFTALSLVDKYDGEEINATARQIMADKYAETDSLTVDAGSVMEYGTAYHLGDMVTVYDKRTKSQVDTWISGAEIKYTSTSAGVKLIMGYAKPKILDTLAKQTDLLKKSQAEFPPTESALPIATTTTLGGIIVGDGLEIDERGVLSTTGTASDTKFATNVLSTGYTIADVIYGTLSKN